MFFRETAQPAIVVLLVSSLILFLSQDWRKMILGLALQYLGVFWLVAGIWPLGLAVIKLVVGWMVAAVLGVSQPAALLVDATSSVRSGRLFKLLTALLILVFILTAVPALEGWYGVTPYIRLGGLMLLGMGLLQLGMTNRPFRVILGLLTVMAGFEVLYASVENSVLVTGLLAIINLGIVMVGAYLIVGSEEGEAE
jgi:hypothetical protein